MRRAAIYYKDKLAGKLTETDEGEYIFQYQDKYQKENSSDCITLTMPVRSAPYIDNRLFAFFEGLIPEGWLLDVATKSWKINRNDRMGLLLACCQNCIGAVSVYHITEKNEE